MKQLTQLNNMHDVTIGCCEDDGAITINRLSDHFSNDIVARFGRDGWMVLMHIIFIRRIL